MQNIASDDLHDLQRQFWDQEHASPNMVLNMDYRRPSGGVVRFLEWVKDRKLEPGTLRGIEMGCGKGRNAIWLAEQGIAMSAFDFSEVGIAEAKKRAQEASLTEETLSFAVHDATEAWPFAEGSFDIGIDCFASTDIESLKGRQCAREEFRRVLNPGGLLFVYAISSQSPFHKRMLAKHPASEENTYFHPHSKIDKIYTEKELRSYYRDFDILALERVQDSKGTFYGKEYTCENFWMVLEKT